MIPQHAGSPAPDLAPGIAPKFPSGTAFEGVRRRWVVPLVLLGLGLAIAALRARTYDEPFERDLVTYMYVADAMNRGGWMYDDVWEIKPPGIYLIYALGERVAGFGAPQLYLINVGAAVATLVGVSAAGAARGRAAGIWAAAFWTLLCGAPSLQANQPNTEVFINGCIVGALALLLRGFEATRSAWPAVAVGVLFALGSIIKQIVVIDALILSGTHVAFAAGLPGGRRRALRDVAIMAAIGAAAWGLLIGAFALDGRLEMFWITIFVNPRAYVDTPLFALYRYIREGWLLPGFLWFAVPVGALVLLGALRDRGALRSRLWALYLSALVALQLKIALNGTSFAPHYYQYWLPMLAIGAGWAAGAKSSRTGGLPEWVMPAAGAIVASFLLVQQGRYYLLSADDWSRLKYGNGAIAGRDLGRAIRVVLRPEETLYQHGNHPELYYYSGHRPPTLLLWKNFLNDTWPVAGILLRRHLAALEKAPPDLVLVDESVDSRPSVPTVRPGLVWRLLAKQSKADEGHNAQAVLDTLLPDYRPVRIEAFRDFPGFRSYALRGSALDRRLGVGAMIGDPGVDSPPGPDPASSPPLAPGDPPRSRARQPGSE